MSKKCCFRLRLKRKQPESVMSALLSLPWHWLLTCLHSLLGCSRTLQCIASPAPPPLYTHCTAVEPLIAPVGLWSQFSWKCVRVLSLWRSLCELGLLSQVHLLPTCDSCVAHLTWDGQPWKGSATHETNMWHSALVCIRSSAWERWTNTANCWVVVLGLLCVRVGEMFSIVFFRSHEGVESRRLSVQIGQQVSQFEFTVWLQCSAWSETAEKQKAKNKTKKFREWNKV